MAKTWVLRTDTKGTGAQMVPLESLTCRPSASEPLSVPAKPTPRAAPPAPPRRPRRFRVVDVMTRQEVLGDGSVQEAIESLRDVRSPVDVTVYLWSEQRGRWRPLTLSEQRAMFELARQ